MKDTIQLGIDGEPLNKPIEFDCPLCGKHITLKKDEKGNVYHRPWTFHWMYDHANRNPKVARELKDNMALWLYYYAFHDQETAKELVEEWKEKIGE